MNIIKPDISVIVPVFNVQKYLVRCLDSIFSQKFSGIFEVIAVEDGSTDNSLQVLNDYREKQPRLRIIEHNRNKKLSIARRTGMDASSGEYIMHVDSDDWLLPDSLENLHKKCIETDADVIVFNYLRETIDGKQIRNIAIKKELITTDKKQVQRFFYGACWNKIVKRIITNEMIYGIEAVNSEEDLLYSSEILIRADKICLIPECFYVWFINPGSITNSLSPELFLMNQITVLKQIEQLAAKHKIEKDMEEKIMNYFEKWIYLFIARIHFWHKNSFVNTEFMIRELFLSPLMDSYRIRLLKSSMKNRLVSLLQVRRRFGLRMSLGIVLRSLKSKV